MIIAIAGREMKCDEDGAVRALVIIGALEGTCIQCRARAWFKPVGGISETDARRLVSGSRCLRCGHYEQTCMCGANALFVHYVVIVSRTLRYYDDGADYVASCGCARRGGHARTYDARCAFYVHHRVDATATGPRYARWLSGAGRMPSAPEAARLRAAAAAVLGRRGEAAAAYVGF